MKLSSRWVRARLGWIAVVVAGSSIGCAGAAGDDSEELGSVQEALCTGSVLSATPGAPVDPGTVVSLSATAPNCGAGEVPEFRFAYKRMGTTEPYVLFQDWSASSTANWDTTGLASGQYDVLVYVRAVGTTGLSTARVNYFLNGVCTSAALASSPAAPQPVGSLVTLTGTASCTGSATPEFLFAYKPSTAATWTQIPGWSTGNVSWDTTGLQAGTYNLIVYARASGNASNWEAVGHGTYKLGGGCGGVGLGVTPSSPQAPGVQVSVSANATCDAGLTPEFRFYYWHPVNLQWVLFQDWNGATAIWDTTGLPLGSYTLRADVRATEHASGAEAVGYRPYALTQAQYSQIATGAGWHSCARVTDGSARCWGLNDFGQLGNGSTADSNTPVQVTGLSNVQSLATGGYHSCAALADGTVRCWGTNSDGHLGDGSQIDSPVPVSVAGLTGVTAISAGTYHNCALKSDGTVWCWGDNEFGQIGTGSGFGNVLTPTMVSGLSGAVAVAAGGWHTCALTSSGTVMCWGLNDFGQLGSGSTNEEETLPVQVASLSAVTAITTGDSHNCALASGQPHCWGLNLYGQLGDGTTTDSNVPIAVNLANISQISAGYAHTCARRNPDGVLQCWGNNDFGQLGDGTFAGSTTPVTVAGITGALTVGASGGLSSCALLSDGTGRCWGDNLYGQLGDGTNTTASQPVLLLGP